MLIELASCHLDNKQSKQTLEILSLAVAMDSDSEVVREMSAAAHFQNVEAAWATGDKDRAQGELSKAADFARQLAKNGSSTGRLMEAYCYWGSRSFSPAVHVYNTAAKDGVEFTAGDLACFGSALLNTHKLKDAKRLLTRAIELDSNIQTAFHSRAVCELRFANPGMVAKRKAIAPIAIQDIERAVVIGPTSMDLHQMAILVHSAAAKPDIDRILFHLRASVENGFDLKTFRPFNLSATARDSGMFERIRRTPEFAELDEFAKSFPKTEEPARVRTTPRSWWPRSPGPTTRIAPVD